MEIEAEKRVKEQQEDDDEQYDIVSKTKSIHEAICIKEFSVTGNLLSCVNTRMIKANLTPLTEMQTKVNYPFK